MSAIVFCTGPCHTYIGVRNAGVGEVRYLGTCEDTPIATLRPVELPVHNAVSGGVPHDVSFQGEEAFIQLDLTRYDELAIDALHGRALGPLAPVGAFAAGDLGTLALTEAEAFLLWLVFPYAAKPVFALQGMKAGYRFSAVTSCGPDQLGPLGTKNRKQTVMLHAIPLYNPATGGHLLYDHDMTALFPPN